MATMFGRFEVQSELSKSDTALIYKALDTETNQVVALKTQSLEPLGDRSDAFVETLIAEGEATRDLVHQNVVLLYGAGEIEGQFCAAMEYIQGNSVATMLARKEGFSIWDLLDITRQVCAGLEHAASKGVTHSSLEPAKIMVQWDGMVKILGYGISNMGLIAAESGNGLGRLMPYCSPEQIRGEAIDQRSNLFTLGAILYEMVVGRQAFEAADPVTLVSRIENETPATPDSVNPKIQPAVSAVVMKALAKDPAKRYQSAHDLLEDLEKCKETKKAVSETKKPTAAAAITVNPAARAAAANKFVTPGSSAARVESPGRPVAAKPATVAAASRPSSTPGSPAPGREAATRTSAMAAGAGLGAASAGSHRTEFDEGAGKSKTDSGARMISDFDLGGSESDAAPSAVMSTAAVEQEREKPAPRIAVDPAMSAPAAQSAAKSFSDLDELPPLKEPVFIPPAPEPVEMQHVETPSQPSKEEKPKVQPREVAEKAIKQIATIPPRLMLFSTMGAVALILVIALVVFFHVRSEDDGSTAAPRPMKTVKPSVPQAEKAPAAAEVSRAVVPVAPIDAQPDLTVRQVEKRTLKTRKAPALAPAAPVVLAGDAFIDSTPQGAQFQVDGKSDPSWITPFTVSGLAPGKHIISTNKTGYSADIRSVEVTANAKSSLVLHLAPVNALLVVNSTPVGAEIVIDGKPTARITPAQFAVEKGSHTVLLRKQGFLEESVTADLGPGQNFQYAPTLKALGNTEEMRTVGKFNKLFGRGGENTAGMGTISFHTQPKGAQVAVNQRLLDKLSPVDVMLGPGNYVVDLTLTGFKPIHKVVTVDKGGKVAIDEILERQ